MKNKFKKGQKVIVDAFPGLEGVVGTVLLLPGEPAYERCNYVCSSEGMIIQINRRIMWIFQKHAKKIRKSVVKK